MSTWDTIKSGIGAVAPTLGAAIGGPFGAAAGKMISSLLTGDESANPEAILNSLQNATPETLVKLKELDNDYKIQMEKIGVTRERLEQMDRESARNREVGLAMAGKRDYTPPALAFFVTVGFFGILYSLVYLKINPSARELVDILIGALSASFGQIVSFYFGDSNGARREIEKIQDKLIK